MAEVFSAQAYIDEMLRDIVAGPLKAAGFRKHARTWAREDGTLIKVINIQLSRQNQIHDASFTVNVGIYHHGFHLLRPGMGEPARTVKDIKEYECDVRARIGQLMGINNHWWTVVWNKDNGKVRDGFRYNFEKQVLAWLDSFHDLSDIYRYFVDHSRFFDAAVAAHLLGLADAGTLLVASHKEANSAFAGTVELWAERHGYKL